MQPQPAPKAASTVMLSPPPQQQQQQQTPLRKQQRRAHSPSTTQPSGSDWVFANLPFAAASSPEVAHAAVTQFAATQLGMSGAALQFSITRVSQQRAGLAIVRLADSDSERALRGAKTKLPSSCEVSIFRSLPPEQRQTAAMQRQSQRQSGFISTQEAAAARNAATDAVAFARTRLATARSPGSNGTLSLLLLTSACLTAMLSWMWTLCQLRCLRLLQLTLPLPTCAGRTTRGVGTELRPA